jgi:outer membrane protein assembly factor BamB
MYGTTKACDRLQFITMNPYSGEIIETGLSSLPSNTGINNIVYDSQYMYLGFNGTGKTIDSSISDAGGVVAYEIDTGDFIWIRKVPGTRGVRSLAVGGGYVVVDGGSFSKQYFLLDSANGEIVQALEKELGTGLITYAFWFTYINSINGVTEQTILFWKERLIDVEQPPILLDAKIVVRTNPGREVGQVKVLDRFSGQTLWETKSNIVSNVVANDSTVFFLTQSSELIAADIESGSTIGSVEFSNEQIQMNEDRGFFVAANNKNVYVYFGDSRQLMTFSFLPEGDR